ncbi:MAG TPA: DUF433 domain-containing protein [Phycisphaerales bacterium]|nr:DUF433 domain-containing protein [Phycisphaerales bacterium]
MDWRKHIHQDPKVCGGVPIIRGTRIPLRVVLANLRAGHTIPEILNEYPTLTEADVRAAIAFAAESSLQDIPMPGTPPITRAAS